MAPTPRRRDQFLAGLSQPQRPTRPPVLLHNLAGTELQDRISIIVDLRAASQEALGIWREVRLRTPRSPLYLSAWSAERVTRVLDALGNLPPLRLLLQCCCASCSRPHRPA